MSSVPIPTFQKCVQLFGNDEGSSIHKTLLEAEFRSAVTLKQQLIFLKEAFPKLTVRLITSLLSISNDRYYNAINGKEKHFPSPIPPPSQKLLSDLEEDEIIAQIHIQQMQNDCMDGRNIRSLATEILKRRTGEEKPFSRDWLMDFRNRHKNSIQKVSAESFDDDRGNINIDDVNRYINNIEEMMKNPPHPFLLINYDEIGFGRRPQKGKRKNVYISKNSCVKPFFREQTDSYHVSVVVAVTAACNDVTPLYLFPRKRFDDDLKDTFFLFLANYFSTPKGYATIQSTLYWVKNNLQPYIEMVRSLIGEDQRCVIITDGLSSHFNEIVMEAINKIGNITVIPIPSHSSHLTQMLDVTIFNAFKRRFDLNLSDGQFESNFTKKLMRIKNSYQSTVCDEIIQSGWEKAGFKLNVEEGEVVSYEFLDEFKEFLRSQALHKEPHENQ